jgi:hypothetical protein
MATAVVVTALLVMAIMLGVLLVATSDPFSIIFIFNFIPTSYKLICKEIEKRKQYLYIKKNLVSIGKILQDKAMNLRTQM